MDENEDGQPSNLEELEGLSSILRLCPEKIRQSPHAGFYVECLREGWALRKCTAYAKQQFNEDICHETFRKLKKIIPSKLMLEKKIKDVFLKGLNPTVDVLQDIYDAIEIQKQRVARALDYETKMAPSAVLPAFMRPAGQEMDRWMDMLKTLAAVQQYIGILQGGQPGIQAPERTTQQIVRELVDDLEPEQKRQYLEWYDAKKKQEQGIQDAVVELEAEGSVEDVTVSDSAVAVIT